MCGGKKRLKFTFLTALVTIFHYISQLTLPFNITVMSQPPEEDSVRENWYTIPNAISAGRIVLGRNFDLFKKVLSFCSAGNWLLYNSRSLRCCSVSKCGFHDL